MLSVIPQPVYQQVLAWKPGTIGVALCEMRYDNLLCALSAHEIGKWCNSKATVRQETLVAVERFIEMHKNLFDGGVLVVVPTHVPSTGAVEAIMDGVLARSPAPVYIIKQNSAKHMDIYACAAVRGRVRDVSVDIVSTMAAQDMMPGLVENARCFGGELNRLLAGVKPGC